MIKEDSCERWMTVARVREANGLTEVMFFESARIYRLLHHNPAYEVALKKLQAAVASGMPVRVRLTRPHGDEIERITPIP